MSDLATQPLSVVTSLTAPAKVPAPVAPAWLVRAQQSVQRTVRVAPWAVAIVALVAGLILAAGAIYAEPPTWAEVTVGRYQPQRLQDASASGPQKGPGSAWVLPAGPVAPGGAAPVAAPETAADSTVQTRVPRAATQQPHVQPLTPNTFGQIMDEGTFEMVETMSKVLAILFLIIGLVMGIMQQSIISTIVGIGMATMLSNMTTILRGLLETG